jgi:hypothetical protein
LRQSGHIALLLCLRLYWAQLVQQALMCVRHLLMFAFELVAADDLRQINLQAPRLLPFSLCQGLLECAAPRLSGVGKPRPALGALQFVGPQRGLPQALTKILPDQRVECLGGGISRGAALSLGCAQRIGAATTAIIGIPRGDGPAWTRPLTPATTHEAA